MRVFCKVKEFGKNGLHITLKKTEGFKEGMDVEVIKGITRTAGSSQKPVKFMDDNDFLKRRADHAMKFGGSI